MLRCSLASGLSLVLATGADPLGPGKGPWVEEKPEAHGLSQVQLDDAKDYLFNKSPVRNCLVVVKDGALVYESYAGLFSNKETSHTGYSMTKTLGALLIGWAQGQGKLDIDADITENYGIKSPASYPVTARHIMSQALDGEDGPGESWHYDAVGSDWINTLPKLLAAAAAEKPTDIWQRQFHVPLGLADNFKVNGWFDQQGIDDHFAYGSSGSCVDYARIGQLMLNKGQWPGVDGAIVPAKFIEDMTAPATRFDPYTEYANPCYGLLTWLNTRMNESSAYPGTCYIPGRTPVPPEDNFPDTLTKDIYFLGGAAGQIVMMVPQDNLVAVTMGTTVSDLGGFSIATALLHGMCSSLKSCNGTAVASSIAV